jgi:hypothetical protein
VYEVFRSKKNSKAGSKKSFKFKIGGDCLQELPLPIATRTGRGGVHAGATELFVTERSLWVAIKSTRLQIMGGGGMQRETRIQKYDLRDGGARLEMASGGEIVVAGWVDQFQLLHALGQGGGGGGGDDTIMAGVSHRGRKGGCPASIETFQKRNNENHEGYVKIGHVDLEGATNVTCFVTVQDDLA